MARVTKDKAGSAGEHTWAHDGATIDVPEDIAAELIRIPSGGFSADPTDDEDADPGVCAACGQSTRPVAMLTLSGEPITASLTPPVFPAGMTLDTELDDPGALTEVPVGLPAALQPTPGGWAPAGGEGPDQDLPHGAVTDIADGVSSPTLGVPATEAEVVSAVQLVEPFGGADTGVEVRDIADDPPGPLAVEPLTPVGEQPAAPALESDLPADGGDEQDSDSEPGEDDTHGDADDAGGEPAAAVKPPVAAARHRSRRRVTE